MIILSCAPQILSIVKLVKLIILIIQIAVPIMLIVSLMLQFASAVRDHDNDALKKASTVAVKRVIAVILLFLIPSLVLALVDLVVPNSGIRECYKSAGIWSTSDKKPFEVPDPAKNLKCSLTLRRDGTTMASFSGGEAGSTYTLYYDGYSENTQKGMVSLDGVFEDVSVSIVGGTRRVKCTVDKIETYDVIQPPAGSTKVASADSATLKINIVKVDNYYLSFIWAENPYKQFNKVHSTNYGKGRETIAKMFDAAIAKEGGNKIMLGTNASGFYVIGTWTPNTKSYNQQYNFTQEGGLVITDGQVIRNWYYDDAVDKTRNDTIYGILPNGYLAEWPNINDYSESDRKKLFDNIINLGVKNTITFRPTLIRKGQIVGWANNSGTNKTTALCQIDRNNFVLYSAPYGVVMKSTVNYLKRLGCQTAVAFDGGGSVSLYFKDRDKPAQKIAGGTRDNIEILYVTENR